MISENLEPELWALGDIVLYDFRCNFCPSFSTMAILFTTPHMKGMSVLSGFQLLYHEGTLIWTFFFPSKTTKVCALPPIFEILPVKLLKARNQTLAPPFPELRCLSLAYNKVTFCFSYSLRGTDWRVGCQLLWPKGQPSNSLHYRSGAQEFSG